jgi:hypothetical protein
MVQQGMDPRVLELLTTQQAAGFPGLAGTEATGTIRLGEALINDAIAATLPPAGRVQRVTVQPAPSDELVVRVALSKPAFLPTMTLRLAIERQPQFPGDPVLVLQLTGGGALLALAAPAISSFGVLPPGVRMDGSRVFVDIRALLAGSDAARFLVNVRHLNISTETGAVRVAFDLAV